MFVFVIERTDYEVEGCPESASQPVSVVVGSDHDRTRAAADKRVAELEGGAPDGTGWAATHLTTYCASLAEGGIQIVD